MYSKKTKEKTTTLKPTTLHVQMQIPLAVSIEDTVNKGFFATKSELVRDSVRRRIAEVTGEKQ